MFQRVCAVALGLFTARTAAASPEVLFHELPGVRPGLCDALRIQLIGSAHVACIADLGVGSVAERIGRLAHAVRHDGAQLGAFLVADDTAGTVQLVVVGSADDAALIRFEPIRNRPAPDVDRSLALKLSDALDTVRRAGTSATAQAAFAGALGQPGQQTVEGRAQADGADTASPAAPAWSALLEAGYGLSVGARVRSQGVATLGARWSNASTALEVGAAGFATNGITARSSAGRVTTRAWAAALALRAMHCLGRAEIGAFANVGLERLSADGQSDSGTRGTRNLALLALSLGLEARLHLFSTAYLRFAPGLTLLPVAPVFAIDGEATLHTGHVRAELPLAIGVRTP